MPKNVELDLYASLRPRTETDWFSTELYRLIGKADRQNRAKLRQVYPEHVDAWENWLAGLMPPTMAEFMEARDG